MVSTPTPQPTAPNLVKTLIRAAMPVVYSIIVSLVARLGYHVSIKTVAFILGGGSIGLTVILHTLERWFPWVGAVLGWMGAPTYAPTLRKAALRAQVAELQSVVSNLSVQVAKTQSITGVTTSATVTPAVASEPAPPPITPPVA